ncbi:unnamed protein product [Haemonchus placei]|uniref:Pept_C1 domain-containing protein n=1 Tax=Haemonchus placei TaxID=6290 RepID=A0A158QKF1_HAEPC|nr:unnamed protein product [Haemonchus placei]
MTGIKVSPQKEVHVPLQPSNEQQELDIPGRLRNKPHRQELLRHPYTENSYALEYSMEYTDRFVEFMKKFGKTYKDDAEMLRRFKIYEKNMREISEMNRHKFFYCPIINLSFSRNGQSNAQFGENDLSDWTDEEFRKTLLPLTFYKKLREEATFIRNDPPKPERAVPAPDFFDWRARNVVSPVKAQGNCGSCWAFAATATVEAAWAIAHGEMRTLSEQTLLDCDFDDNACDGGDEDKAFRSVNDALLTYSSLFNTLYSYIKLREEATFIRNDPPKPERAVPAPDFFDWRARNVVSPVKAQGNCGSCWAFAATATVEAAWAIAHGEMRTLSEQTLLDCDFDDNACDGGDEDKAFRYIHRHGLAYTADLPYVAHRQNTCRVDGNVTKIEVAYFIHPDEQSIIDWLVGYGPVNIGIAVTPDMKPYKGGVFTPNADDCKHKVVGLHSLMITGYGTTEAGEKYWIVKNSWGNTWGVEHGYVYFARGINACGIEDEPIGILA